jgi:immunity protein 74 of polymorphic toxin system
MQLRWASRGRVYSIIDGRTLLISGEALLEGDPDYLIYPQYIKQWEDGSPLSEEEKNRILADVIAEAARQGWKFEVEQENAREETPWKYRKT